MTQAAGIALLILLIAVLLLREAVGLGLLKSSTAARRGLNWAIVVLGTSFLVAIAAHLVTL